MSDLAPLLAVMVEMWMKLSLVIGCRIGLVDTLWRYFGQANAGSARLLAVTLLVVKWPALAEVPKTDNCGESERDRRTGCGRSAPALVRRLATSMVPPEPLLSGIKPPMSRQAWLRFLLTHIPILHWTWTYKLQYFIPDIMAGLTVGVMHIPQGLAYGLLTGLDPVYGLYTSFVPVIVYSILGTSRQLSTGTFAVICLMVGNSINQVFSDKGLDLCREEDSSQLLINGTNTTCGEMEVEVAVSLALTSGIIMMIMGCFQMGFVTIFLSEPLISGYTTGAALLVCTTQLPHIFGTSLKLRPVIAYFPDVVSLPSIITIITTTTIIITTPTTITTTTITTITTTTITTTTITTTTITTHTPPPHHHHHHHHPTTITTTTITT
eukprot:Em0520g1a